MEKKKKKDIHKFDDHVSSSVGQLICSSYAIKPMQKVVKLVLTGVVDNGESKGRQKPTNLPTTCAKKEVQISKRSLNNWQTLCKREAREVGLFRASPWSTNSSEAQCNGYSKFTNLYLLFSKKKKTA